MTRSTESRLSTVAPYLRISQPMPPPSVRPAIPVWVTIPPTVARPWSCVSRSSSPQSAGLRLRRSRSRVDLMPFIGERSITSPRRRPHARRRRDHRSGLRPAARARVRSARCDTSATPAAGDVGRTAVNRAIPDPAGSVVARLLGSSTSPWNDPPSSSTRGVQGRCLRCLDSSSRPPSCARSGSRSHASNVGLPAPAD